MEYVVTTYFNETFTTTTMKELIVKGQNFLRTVTKNNLLKVV